MNAIDPAEEARRDEVRRASFLIVAMGADRAIGDAGTIPWRQRADMAHFRNATQGCALIVGRTTFETLPPAMPGRQVVVVTSRPIAAHDRVAGSTSAPDFDEAVRFAIEDSGCAAVAFAGGPRIYEAALALPWVRRALVTEIAVRTGGDAFMPGLGREWTAEAATYLANRDGEPSARALVLVRPAIAA